MWIIIVISVMQYLRQDVLAQIMDLGLKIGLERFYAPVEESTGEDMDSSLQFSKEWKQ